MPTIRSKKIEMVDSDNIVPNPKNANRHTEEQIQRLKKLIKFQGFRNPLIVSNRSGFLIVGHGRLEAAKELGLEKLPVIYQDFEDEAQEYAYLVSDNEIARWASLDKESVLEDIKEIGLEDIEMLGLEEFEIPEVEVLDPQTDEDEVPEVEEPITRRGDIWLLGKHRLMCGDSTMIDDVEKLMNGEKADMVFTDPPYGVDYQGGHNEKKRQGIKNDKLEGVDLTRLFQGALANADIITKDNCAFYIWFSGNKFVEVARSFDSLNIKLRDLIYWYKVRSGLGAFMAQYIPNAEPCIYGYKGKAKWRGGSDEKTVWELQKIYKNEHHPTQKPVELSERAITNSSDEKDLVFDCFLGSGATLIGAENTNRKCYGMELDEKYCDVIINRWQNYTGKKATLESTGQTYEELRDER